MIEPSNSPGHSSHDDRLPAGDDGSNGRYNRIDFHHLGPLPDLDAFTRDLPELTPDDDAWDLTDDDIDRIVAEEWAGLRRRKRAAACLSVLEDAIECQGDRAELARIWRRHVALNEARDDVSPVGGSPVAVNHLPDGLGDLFLHNRLEVVDRLAEDVKGLVFTGPFFNLLLLEEASRSDVMIFRIYHMMMHLMARHACAGEYGFRLEWRHGAPPLVPVDPTLAGVYVDQEADADDAAVCLMHSAYADEEFSRAFLRRAVQHGAVRPSVIRSAIHDRSHLYHVLASALRVVTPPRLRDALHPLTRYTGALALATGPNHPVYLLQRRPGQDRPFKRWIPSRKVLARLGAENGSTDVVWLGAGELKTYPDGPMLWDPDEVDVARDYLLATSAIVRWPAIITTSRQRVPGLSRKPELPGGLWPEVAPEPKASILFTGAAGA